MTDVAELGLKVHSEDVDKANKRLDQMKGSANLAEAAISKLTSAALKLVAAYASWKVAGAIVDRFVRSTVEAEQAQRRLETVVRSTGGAAGLTVAELNRMADALSKVTTYSDTAITKAQSILLGYGRIGRETFPAATEAVLDMAAALGMDLSQAAETVGKALDLPSRGMTSLAERGFMFSKAQIETARRMEETGRIAEAQKFVLDELAFAYGDAAREARGTLGGALEALGNAFDKLFDANGPEAERLRVAVEQIIDKLTNPSTIAAVQSFGAALLNAFASALPTIIDIIDRIGRFFDEMTARSNDPQLRAWYKNEGGTVEGATNYLRRTLNSGQRHMAGERSFGMDMGEFFQPFNQDEVGLGGGSFEGLQQFAGLSTPGGTIISDKTATALERQAKAYDQLIISAQGRIDQLKLEAEAANLTAYETARQEEYQRLLQATMKAGVELSPEQITELEVLAAAYADATLTLEGLHIQMENRTPWQVMAEEIERLNELMERGKITADDYWTAMGRAAENMVSDYARGANDVIGNIEKITEAMGLEGRKAFEVQKVLGIARAVVSGGEAVVHSFNAGAAIGGPPVGFTFAGIAAAATAAQIAAIASSTYQSKQVPTSVAGAGATPTAQPGTQSTGPSANITIYGDSLGRKGIEDLVKEINKLQRDRGGNLNLRFA